MRKFVPTLRSVLIGAIAVIIVFIAMNLFLGNTKAMLQMVFPLIGGLFALGALTNFSLVSTKCPQCSMQQPLWRKPTSLRQGLLGGWTCSNCGTEVDRNGQAIVPNNG